jgi:chromosome partitioning protein
MRAWCARRAATGGRSISCGWTGWWCATARLGFRCVEGFAERLVYRQLFPRGLTALDEVAGNLSVPDAGVVPGGARDEVARLIGALRLPLDATGLRRAQARREWFAARSSPLEMHEFLDV